MPAVRESRLSIRVDSKRKAIIARAAKLRGETVSEFVLENAYQIARNLLADEGQLDLTKQQVAEMFAILDNPPPESVARFKKMLNTPSIVDG